MSGVSDTLIKKLAEIEREVAAEKGEFSLFGLFLRDYGPRDRWDLVVDAPWIREDRSGALDLLVGEIRSRLDPRERLLVSAIIIVKDGDPFRDAMKGLPRVEHELLRVDDVDVPGPAIETGYLITNR